jgi:uncharacterized protein YgiM (DUF1202 family)
MKRTFVVLFIFLGGMVFAQVSRGSTQYVAVRSAVLKSSTGFFAATRGTLAYGAQVTVLQVRGKWVEVRSASSASLSGWTALSNLTSRRVSAAASSTASREDVAMAGKGLSEEIENSYRTQGEYNYTDLDRMEAQSVTDEELLEFITEGRLSRGN